MTRFVPGRRIGRSALTLALALMAASCGGSDGDQGAGGDSGPGNAGAAECGANTELVVSSYTGPGTLDPYTGGGDSAEAGGSALRAIYDTLVRFDPSSGTFSPHLARSINPSDDLTEWTVELRDGIAFGNGDPFDAAAVKASIDRHIADDSESRLQAARDIISAVEVVDEHTVRFQLVEPWSEFPSILAAGIGMIQNVAVVEELGADNFGELPVGAGVGPYEPTAFTPEEVVLEAKGEDYWAGPPCVGRLRFVTLAENRTAYDAFSLGEIDVMYLFRDPVLAQRARGDADGGADFEIHSQYQLGGLIVLPNASEQSPTGDVRVRQAIAHAIDPVVVNERAYGGAGLGSSALVPEGAEQLTPTEGPQFDPDKARELVDEVRADLGWDGSVRLDCANSPQSEVEACIAIAAMLDAVGMKTVLTTTHTQVAQRTLVRAERNFDLALWGIVAHEENLWMSLRQFDSEAPNNAGQFASAALDDLLDELRLAAGPEERDDVVSDIQDVINEEVPFVTLAPLEPTILVRSGVEGLVFDTNMNLHFGAATVD